MSTTTPDATPLVSSWIRPRASADTISLRARLSEIVSDDPLLAVTVNPETGDIVLHGQDEHHLESAIGKLRGQGIDVEVGAPQVAYREGIARAAEVDIVHSVQAADAELMSGIRLRLEANESGAGNRIFYELGDASVQNDLITALEDGIRAVWSKGVFVGFPIIDTKATLICEANVSLRDAGPRVSAAASDAMRKACEIAGIRLLEPMMHVKIGCPAEFVGSIVGDLNSRRAQILAINSDSAKVVMEAFVPFAHLFGYSKFLSHETGHLAHYRMKFSHYAEVSRHVLPDPNAFPPAVGMRA